mmetsp:Transcript_33130/g.87985  ORF Transcript_33130/g.87985 Transcript_33130/m.87985 type:complete len:118 (+) Transcript_33130:60-413(+)
MMSSDSAFVEQELQALIAMFTAHQPIEIITSAPSTRSRPASSDKPMPPPTRYQRHRKSNSDVKKDSDCASAQQSRASFSMEILSGPEGAGLADVLDADDLKDVRMESIFQTSLNSTD